MQHGRIFIQRLQSFAKRSALLLHNNIIKLLHEQITAYIVYTNTYIHTYLKLLGFGLVIVLIEKNCLTFYSLSFSSSLSSHCISYLQMSSIFGSEGDFYWLYFQVSLNRFYQCPPDIFQSFSFIIVHCKKL